MYRGFHEGHYFILIARKVHGTPGCDMDWFIKECACLFHIRLSESHRKSFIVVFFAFNFLGRALNSPIERKIVLAGDACSKPPTTIRSHDLHASNIRGPVGEIASYHERD